MKDIFTQPKRLILLFSLVLIFNNAIQSQIVDFTYAGHLPNEILCDPHTFTFEQACTGNPVGFIWNFGNGERSSDNSETISYDRPGTYSVTLTAVYANTAISTTKTIVIHPTPLISLTGDQYTCKPGVINLKASGSSFITKYEWDFGDGTPVTDTFTNTISHSYKDYGTFIAKVNVITAAGCRSASSFDIHVNKFPISGTLSSDTGCIPSTTVLAVSGILPPGDRLLNYTWDFGDGAPVKITTDSTVTHLYNITDSTSTANVTAISAQGCTNKFNFSTFAFGTPPFNTVAKTVLLTDSFCGSETIEFTCRSTKANMYKWEFGDSTSLTVTDTLATHKYRSLGNKRVIVTPFFNGCEGTKDTIDIFIKGVIAIFSYNNLCNNKRNFQFTNSSLGNSTHFDWGFSDSPNLKDSLNLNPQHMFPVYGSFKAVLSLFDSNSGCSDTATQNIYTAVPVLNSNMNSVCKDSLIVYSVSSTFPDAGGYNYTFYINGDSVNTGLDSVLNYYPKTHGSFLEHVVIKDAVTGTCDDTLWLENNIIVKGPIADFTSPDRLCLDKSFPFTNKSDPFYPREKISKWEWDFGDDIKDLTKDPQPHQYKLRGFHNISLRVTDINGCGNLYEKRVLSDKLPKIFVFPLTDTICYGKDTAMITAYTIDTLVWMPNTSISCNTCDTGYVNPVTTTYYVAQATTPQGCQKYDTAFIKVYSPINLKVFPPDTTVCPGQEVHYDLNTEGITLWSPATKLSNSTIKDPVVRPVENSSCTVIVKDSAGCYADAAVADIKVFSLAAVNAGENRTIPYNTSFNITPVYGHDVVSWQWQPAAGLSCTNCASPSGIALNTTTYTVKTISVNGCVSSDNITIAVACEKSNILLPTAFSPNGNGLNEYFYPIGRGYKTIKRFVIFNRQGNKVFERKNFIPNNPSSGWDGIMKNAETVSSTETFAWYLEAECDQGELITKNGTVVLLR